VAVRAAFSASDDCQPDSLAVPVIDFGSKAAVLGAVLSTLPPGATLGAVPVLPAGVGVAPPLQAPTIRTMIVKGARNRRMCLLLMPAGTSVAHRQAP